MSWISRLFFGADVSPAIAAYNLVPESKWYESTAKTLVFQDFYGTSDAVTRTTAMSVPPVKRGRALIVGSLADLPLSAGRFDGDTWAPVSRQPAWLNRSTTVQTPWHRIANTVDDLIFAGWALWLLNRSDTGTILDAVHVSRERWSFDQHSPTGVRINNEPVTDPATVILFQGPDEGLLATGAESIRSWRALDAARLGKARNPIPMIVLHETESNGMTPEEAQELVAAWAKARRDPDGAVGFLSAGVALEVYGDVKPELYEQAFNALRLDVANHLNLPASLLDGSTATASLTYVTTRDQRTALIDYLEYWLSPIEARLSQPDVTPQGQLVRFDRSNLTSVPNDTHGPEQSDEPEAIEPPIADAA